MGGDQEKSIIEKFLEDNVLFLGPDPEIMRDHRIAAETEREREALAANANSDDLNSIDRSPSRSD